MPERPWPELKCPQGHPMGWLGVCYWLCPCCHIIFVEKKRPFVATKLGWYA